MGERTIKTGLSKKYKDMLDAVIGQMSDGYWENSPMMRGYWKFVTTGTSGNEVTLVVDTVSGARDGDSRIENRFYGMSDDAVKKFFADKIKFLVKEEVGPWERDNEATTDYLSYGEPRYRVKDCYYAYEILKGRNARKHPEYGDVAESFSVAEENEWWQWLVKGLQERARDGKSGIWNENCRMKAGSQNAYSLLALAKEFADKWHIDFRSYTNKLGSPFFEFTWTAEDAACINKELAKKETEAKTNGSVDSGKASAEGSISKGQCKMGIKFIKKNESFESDLENIAQSSGEIDYGDAMALNRAAAGDKEIHKKVRDLVMDWRNAAEDADDADMTKAAKALKTLADSLSKHEARMHLGRCKNCGHGWTKTSYLDELEPAVRKYFKAKGYPDNADICPKCVAAAKDYLAKNAASESGEELYNVFLDGDVWAENVSKEKANAIVNAYDGEKDCWMEKADANESFEGWDNWEEVEGLEDALDGIENLTYELRSCVRGAKTHCKDWKSLALYIKGLAANLEDAAELMAYKRDGEDESKKKNPSKDFSSTVEEDEDGKKKSH